MQPIIQAISLQPEDFSAWSTIFKGWRNGITSMPESLSQGGQTRAAFSLEFEGAMQKIPSNPLTLFLGPDHHNVYHGYLTVTEKEIRCRLNHQRGEMFLLDEWVHQPIIRVELTYRSATPLRADDELTLLVEVMEDKPVVYQAAFLVERGIPAPDYAGIFRLEMDEHHAGSVLRKLNSLLQEGGD